MPLYLERVHTDYISSKPQQRIYFLRAAEVGRSKRTRFQAGATAALVRSEIAGQESRSQVFKVRAKECLAGNFTSDPSRTHLIRHIATDHV